MRPREKGRPFVFSVAVRMEEYEMAKTGNSNLHDSSRNKQDEFYTNLQLIEDELKHYRHHFRGKRVLCNCDDPWEAISSSISR